MKIQTNFMNKKIIFVFNKNTNQFCDPKKKKSDLYLMKIQISFVTRKNSNLYLMKIQINVETRKNSDLYLMKIQISLWFKKIRYI